MVFKMKKFLNPLVIAAIVTAIVSCGDNGDPTSPLSPHVSKNFIITFVDDDEITLLSEPKIVAEGSLIIEPEEPVKIFTITEPGLYRGKPSAYTFDGWYNGDTKWDFDVHAVTTDITLKANWIEPEAPPERITAVNPNDIPASVTQINSGSGEYTLLISADAVIAGQTLNKAGVHLTIMGIGEERRIKLSTTGTLFTVNSATVSLTIGENITLAGITGNNNSLVKVQNGNFTMLDCSMITGNVSGATGDGNGRGAAVYVAGATSIFTMKGGAITGNGCSVTGTKTTGGVFVENNGSFFMEGGSVEGNTAISDVHIDSDAVYGLVLSGHARIGQLTLSAASAAANVPPPCITIAAGWTGKVYNLNLRGDPTGVMNTAIGYWYPADVGTPRRTILKSAADDYTLSAADVKKFPLGNFMTNNENDRREISANYMIANSGDDIGKLVLKQ